MIEKKVQKSASDQENSNPSMKFETFLMRNFKALCALSGLISVSLVLLAYMSSKFHSEGLYQLFVPVYRSPESSNAIAIAQPSFTEFKRILSATSEESRFNTYLSERGLSSNSDLRALGNLIPQRTELAKLLEPQFAISRNDAKDLVDLGVKENATQIMGIKVFPGSSNPGSANLRAVLLAEYVRDTAFHLMITDFGRAKESELQQQSLSLSEQVIGKTYELSMLTQKVGELSKVSTSGKVQFTDAGQVIGLNESTTRFLPVQTQISATKVQVLELSQSLERMQRQLTQSELMTRFYKSLRIESDRAKTGQSLVERLPFLLEETMKSVDRNDEKFKQVSLILQLENQKIVSAFADRSRFISGPSTPAFRTWQPALVLLVSLLSGFALALLVVFFLRYLGRYKH
jgi:hypothetical protein